MRGAHFLQPLAHDPVRQLRMVAVLAQVPQIKVTQLIRDDLLGGIGRGFVGKMPVTAEDALLDAPRAARIVLKHFHVMIRFEHEHIRGPDTLEDKPGGVAEVSQESDAPATDPKEKPDRVIGVMGHAERIDHHVTDFETCARAKNPAVELHVKLGLDGLVRQAIAVNRDLKPGAETGQTLNMVRVFVCKKNAIKCLGRTSDTLQALPNLATAESGINKQARLARFDVAAIAARAAAENCELHSHGAETKSVRVCGQSFWQNE